LQMEICLPSTFKLVSCSAYYSTLKMEEKFSSETSVKFQRTTRRYIPEESSLHSHRCENLKPYTGWTVAVYFCESHCHVYGWW
jgi:hypothetical protein